MATTGMSVNKTFQILALSPLTTPALLTASAGSSSGGVGFGYPVTIQVEVTRTTAGMTGVAFTVWGSRDRTNWVQLPVYKSSDTGKTLATSVTLSPSQGASAYEGLVCDAAKGWPWLDVRGQAAGANGGTGDSCAAYLPPVS